LPFSARKLVLDRVVDDGGGDVAVLLQRDRDRPVRHGVEEVRGAVERVDDPAALGLPDLLAALLEQHPEVGPGAPELVADHLLGAPVGGGDEVAGPLIETWRCSTSPKSR
jgi:hypothetical protein